MITVYPTAIAPLFNKYTPLEEGPLRCGGSAPRWRRLAEGAWHKTELQGAPAPTGQCASCQSLSCCPACGRFARFWPARRRQLRPAPRVLARLAPCGREAIEALAASLSFPLRKLFVVDGSRRSAHSNAYQVQPVLPKSGARPCLSRTGTMARTLPAAAALCASALTPAFAHRCPRLTLAVRVLQEQAHRAVRHAAAAV